MFDISIQYSPFDNRNPVLQCLWIVGPYHCAYGLRNFDFITVLIASLDSRTSITVQYCLNMKNTYSLHIVSLEIVSHLID
jgi:hypothetical protein